MYKVSLVIPVFNVEKYIKESLYSALNQTFLSIEYVIVDDCGNDFSMSVIAEILKNHPRVNDVFIIKHEKNRGLSAARNTGLGFAHGDYVFFMDSDDELIPECIELHYNTIKNSNADFTVANIQLEGAKSMHIKNISVDIEYITPLKSYILRMWNVSACNKLYSRSFLTKYNLKFQEGLLHEDILWAYYNAMHARKISLVERPTYLYKIRSNSITTCKNEHKRIDSLLYTLNSIRSSWEQGMIPIEYARYYAKFLNFYCLNTALLLLNYEGSYKERSSYFVQIVKLKSNIFILDLASLLLLLPFRLFSALITPMYLLYKKKSRL